MRIRLIAAFLLGPALIAAPAWSASYSVSEADSKLGFTGEVGGESFDGHFKRFSGRIEFAAEALQQTRFDIEIDMRSVDTDSEERDEALATSEWFDPEQHPSARFVASGARREGNEYLSDAELSIRNVAKPAQFRFSLSDDGQRLRGSATLNRIDWDLGGADWSDEEVVGHTVQVSVDVRLHNAE